MILFTVQISRKNIGFLDVRDISSEAIVDLAMDILADEKSILRRVFGISLSLSMHMYNHTSWFFHSALMEKMHIL